MTISQGNQSSQNFSSKLLLVMSMALVVSALGGCTQSEKDRAIIEQKAKDTAVEFEHITKQGEPAKFNPLVVTDKIWAGDVALRIHRGVPLPPRYESERGITVVSADPMSIGDIAAAITSQTGIPVRVQDLGNGAVNVGVSNIINASNNGRPGAPPIGGFNSGFGGGSSSSIPSVPIAYEGTLSGFLERIAGNFGLSWHYDGNTIYISRFETRVFVIEAMPGTQQVKTEMNGGSSSGGSSGGGGGGGSSGGGGGSGASAGGTANASATLTTKTDVDIKYWEELKEILASMLAGTGTVVLSPSLGTVTVTTSPEIMQTVANYISQENERMTRQVAINIEVYNISLVKNEDFNITFSSFIRKMGQFGPSTLTGATVPAILDSTDIPTQSTLATANVGVINQGAGHTSITDVLGALSQVVNSTRVAEFPMVTLNNRPVSVRVGEDFNYIASTSSSTTSSGTSSILQVTATPATINEGFSVQVSPRILDDGRVLLQYALTSVDLKSLTNFDTCSGCTSGSSTLQLADTLNRTFNQQTILRSGSTLVIAGEGEKDVSQNAQGVGSPYNFVFGGGTSDNATNTMLLIAITPQVIELPRAEHG